MSTSLLNRTAVRGSFFRQLAESSQAMLIPKLSIVTPDSKGASELYGFTGAAPPMTKWLGARNTKTLTGRRITVSNDLREASVVIDKLDYDRDQTGEIQRKMADLSTRAAELPIKMFSDLIRLGNGSTMGTAYDGQNFYSASHSFGASGTQKNLLTSSEVASLDIATATAPTPEEWAAAIMDVYGYMLSYLDDTGEPLHLNSKEMVIMCAPGNWGALNTAIAANVLSSGKTNALAVANGLSITGVPNPRLYSAGTAVSAVWYAFLVDSPSAKPLIFQSEGAPEVEILAEGSDFYFDNHAFKVGVNWSAGAGYGEPLKSARCTFS